MFHEMTLQKLYDIWPFPTLEAAKIVFIFCIIQVKLFNFFLILIYKALLMLFIPGKDYWGPITETGNI